ncbi:MAG: 3-dehydroquinate synthase [Eubacterium sp.]
MDRKLPVLIFHIIGNFFELPYDIKRSAKDAIILFIICEVMMQAEIINVTYNQKPCYDIIFNDTFDLLAQNISKIFKGTRICIVTETNVGPLYAEKVLESINSICNNIKIFTFNAGEDNKNLNTVNDIYHFLITNKFDRNDMLIALGGGVTGDITGFCAATYLRGIDFIQIPTSLLAQVDSSIGGKTGVDFECYKNMVGAFKQPKMVYINVSTLKTLPEREYISGMGEIIKHGIIKDSQYFWWLHNNSKQILEREPEIILKMIIRSCIIKKLVVEDDPEEKGERALLNFGHTLGHAIEKELNFSLLHGECVSLGICCASYISQIRGFMDENDLDDIIDTLMDFSLPCKITDINKDNIISYTKNDKKAIGDSIKFILSDHIGHAFICKSVTDDEMSKSLDFLMGLEQ